MAGTAAHFSFLLTFICLAVIIASLMEEYLYNKLASIRTEQLKSEIAQQLQLEKLYDVVSKQCWSKYC